MLEQSPQHGILSSAAPGFGPAFMAFATIAFGPRPAQAAVTEAWVQRYGSEAGSEDIAYKVVTDAAANVIVAGSTHNQTGSGSDMSFKQPTPRVHRFRLGPD